MDNQSRWQPGSTRETRLPPEGAFVVQFRDPCGQSAALPISGRVEHVVSGRVARFESLAELMKFVEGVLCAGGEPTDL